MLSSPRIVVSRLLLAGFCLAGSSLLAQTWVRTVKVLGSKGAVEIEVESSDRVVPQTQVVTGPDRLVIDFPNALPGSELRSQSVNQGEVKDVRIGLFQAKPPVTRLVFDLKTAQSYQVFPNGRTVMIKIVGVAGDTTASVNDHAPEPPTRPGLVIANYKTGAERVGPETPAKPPLEVSFRDGLLAIKSNKATLSEVLYAVQQRTGAEVSIAAGAEQERVVADIAPAPAAEVLARLLNGSKFNFLILSAANDPRRLDRVILTPRAEGAVMPLPPVPTADDAEDDMPPPPAPVQPQPASVGAAPVQVPPQQPEIKPQSDDAPEQ
jgi:antitoxin (DNA-binding transcriptional repressor) of toxin-antitoxin stability system